MTLEDFISTAETGISKFGADWATMLVCSSYPQRAALVYELKTLLNGWLYNNTQVIFEHTSGAKLRIVVLNSMQDTHRCAGLQNSYIGVLGGVPSGIVTWLASNLRDKNCIDEVAEVEF